MWVATRYWTSLKMRRAEAAASRVSENRMVAVRLKIVPKRVFSLVIFIRET